MSEAFSKPADQIGPNDIQSLIDLEVPEGQHIEFKETLPAEEGSVDPWIRTNGKKGMGKYARDCLLEEVVAFANAYGGVLILGIEESSSEPPVATNLKPLPNCADLVGRLRQAFRDCVEPQIPRIEIFAVATNDDEGVVFIRVGKSQIAPHRVSPTRSCKMRRADRSEEMSMREIQDMTLNMSRGLERLGRQFADRENRFEQEFKHLLKPDKAFGVRVTGIPMGEEIRLDRVYRPSKIIDELEEEWRGIHLTRNGGEPSELEVYPDLSTIFWRPLLRAVRGDSSHFFVNKGHIGNLPAPNYNSYREVHCNGLVELAFVASKSFGEPYDEYLPPNVPIALIANLIVQAVRIREFAGTPTAEYAIEVQILAKGTTITVNRPGPQYGRQLGFYDSGSVSFPRYPLGDSHEALYLLNLFQRDLYNSLGIDIDNEENTFTIGNWPHLKSDHGEENAS